MSWYYYCEMLLIVWAVCYYKSCCEWFFCWLNTKASYNNKITSIRINRQLYYHSKLPSIFWEPRLSQRLTRIIYQGINERTTGFKLPWRDLLLAYQTWEELRKRRTLRRNWINGESCTVEGLTGFQIYEHNDSLSIAISLKEL